MSYASVVLPPGTRRRPKPDDARSCAVPSCPRWSRQFTSSFLCGFHWRRLSRRERAAMRRVWRTCRRFSEQTGVHWWANKSLRRREAVLWRACVRRASTP